MKSKILVVFALLTLFSCKQEFKADEVKPVVELKSDTFDVTLNVVAKKDDSFHLYYTEDGSINFTEANSVWVEFKGSEASQDLVFKLPVDVLPTHLRLDFGVNKAQEDIVMNSFKMAYMDKNVLATKGEFFNYFYPNEKCTQIDVEKSLIIPVKIGDAYSGPMFYPQVLLSEKISEMVKG